MAVKKRTATEVTTKARTPSSRMVAKRLRQLLAISKALPEAQIESQPRGASIFRVKKKVFAYFLADHHGDGIVAVAMKTAPGQNAALIAADGARFYSPAHIGARDWVGVRLDVDDVDWQQVRELLTASYRATAPAKLAVLV